MLVVDEHYVVAFTEMFFKVILVKTSDWLLKAYPPIEKLRQCQTGLFSWLVLDCSFYVLFNSFHFQAPPGPRQPSGGTTVPQPSKPPPTKQPVNDLLGDLGGDPFAQPAGT